MDVHMLSACIGVALALGVGIAGTAAGMDRDRALYPAVLIAIAALYGLFGTIDGTASVIAIEITGMVPFVVAALLGFRRTLWFVVAGLLCHGLYDFIHGRIVHDAGVPPWWPLFCLTYDATAALYLAWLLARSTVTARPAR